MAQLPADGPLPAAAPRRTAPAVPGARVPPVPVVLAAPRRRAGSRLLAVGAGRPEQSVTAGMLGAPFGRDAEWVRSRTGIESLRRAPDDDVVLGLARVAAETALKRAGLAPGDIDVALTASCSLATDRTTADALLHAAAPGIAGTQLNSACAGFCSALATADAMVRAGTAEHVLVVAAERMSGIVDPTDLGTSIIFGDGAGAAVVGPADEPGVGPVVWGSDGAQAEMIHCGTDRTLVMAGRSVFRWAVEQVPVVALEACRRAGVSPAEIEVFVPHQANLRIIDAVVSRLGLTGSVVAQDVRAAGNTSAASIPLALEDLLERGAARPGQLALLLGFGAGLSWAGQVVVLP